MESGWPRVPDETMSSVNVRNASIEPSSFLTRATRYAPEGSRLTPPKRPLSSTVGERQCEDYFQHENNSISFEGNACKRCCLVLMTGQAVTSSNQ